MDPIDEQKKYYQARAHEYDQAFERLGRYDRGAEANERWFTGVNEIREELAEFQPFGDVLEIACGTGNWTPMLAERATQVLALDASAEMLQVAQSKTNAANVDWLEADVFRFRPPRKFDVVFFGFWISHVPRSRFRDFWAMVAEALKADGRVFFFDTMPNSLGGAAGQAPPATETDDERRELNNGRSFTIVKRYFTPQSITRDLLTVGFQCQARVVADHFLLCQAASS